MKRFTETHYNIKDAIGYFVEGLKDDINNIKISLKWKIILCSLFIFGIVSYIYPPNKKTSLEKSKDEKNRGTTLVLE